MKNLMTIAVGFIKAEIVESILKKQMIVSGKHIDDWAYQLINNKSFEASKEISEVDIVVATAWELTGKYAATTKEIFHAIEKTGGQLCLSDVGLQLRFQYENQLEGEWLHIAMKPLNDSFGTPRVFCVGRNQLGPKLTARQWAWESSLWDKDTQWAFIKRGD